MVKIDNHPIIRTALNTTNPSFSGKAFFLTCFSISYEYSILAANTTFLSKLPGYPGVLLIGEWIVTAFKRTIQYEPLETAELIL